MPGGPTISGLVVFTAVKIAGYSFAGHRLNKLCRTARPNPAVFGVARTVLGLAAGITFGLGLGLAASELAFYLALAPVRMCEWLLVLWLFYRRSGLASGRWLMLALLGSLWSYFLDLPAIFAMVTLPGGMWIC